VSAFKDPGQRISIAGKRSGFDWCGSHRGDGCALGLCINASFGGRLYLAREYDRSIAQLRDTLEMDPAYEWAHLTLGQAYEQKGQFGLAIEELQKAVELSHSSPLTISALAHAEALSGNHAAANKLLTQLEALSKSNMSRRFVSLLCTSDWARTRWR